MRLSRRGERSPRLSSGIPESGLAREAQQAELFQPFKQADAATKSTAELARAGDLPATQEPDGGTIRVDSVPEREASSSSAFAVWRRASREPSRAGCSRPGSATNRFRPPWFRASASCLPEDNRFNQQIALEIWATPAKLPKWENGARFSNGWRSGPRPWLLDGRHDAGDGWPRPHGESGRTCFRRLCRSSPDSQCQRRDDRQLCLMPGWTMS